MKIDFSGAAGSVTGSSHLFEVNGRKVLVDCGLYQGRDAREKSNDSFLFNPGEIDFLLVSHAHIDHTGRI
ncbi:MAG: MBL fold metallo-hydrolase, partial [Clostridiaceae bacterium]